MQFRFLLFLVSTIVVVASAASISDVSNDFGALNAQAIKFNKVVAAFPHFGGNADDFSGIQARAALAKSTLNATASDVKTMKGPISESEGQSLLILVLDVIQNALTFIETLVANKPAFELAAFDGAIDLVRQDMIDFMNGGSHLAHVLISQSPPDVGAQVNQSTAILNKAFEGAIKLYS